jgi:hypothetical protein
MTPALGRNKVDAIGSPQWSRSDEQEGLMAKFMDIHNGFFGVTAKQLADAHDRDVEIQADEGVVYEHAWLDAEAGKVFCLASGPSREAVIRVHERAGHPTPEVYEITAEVA